MCDIGKSCFLRTTIAVRGVHPTESMKHSPLLHKNMLQKSEEKDFPKTFTPISLYTGPSIKYVTLEGVREGVTLCDRGRGSRACDVTLIISFITHMKHEI